MINTLLNYSDVFFSKCAILCEGDTEFGSFPILANKLECDLDQYGITLLKLDGVHKIKLYQSILNKFKIHTYSIIDADKKEDYGHLPHISFLGEDPIKNGAYEWNYIKMHHIIRF